MTSSRIWDKMIDATLYARWNANQYTITFNPNGGSGGTPSTTATYGSAMPSASAPTYTGYIFAGYFDAASGGTQYYSATMTSVRTWNKTSNTTLFAQWIAPGQYLVTLNSNGGSGGTTSVIATSGSAMPSATAPTRTGYEFLGYFDATSGGTQYYSATMSSSRNWDKTSNATLYAKWSGNKEISTVGIFYNEALPIANPTLYKFSAKGLPAGLKVDAAGSIVGVPTKSGNYTAIITATNKTNKNDKQVLIIPIGIVAIAPNAIGTFTGFLSKNNTVVGTWKMTTNKAGKITAKVVTSEGTFAFKSNSWDALDTNSPDTYSVSMRMLDKQKIYQTFSVDVDTANEWHSIAVLGTLSLGGSATIAGFRNPFLDKNNYEAQQYLAPYITTRPQPNTYFVTWTGSTVSQYLTRGKLNVKSLDSNYGYVIFTVKKGGAISYKGRFNSSQEKITGTSTLLTMGSDIYNIDGVIPTHYWNPKTESSLRARFYLP